MTTKLDYFINKSVAEKIHNYLIQFKDVDFNDNARTPIIGYKRRNQRYKFATLHGGNSYQSLVLHVDPGTRVTTVGKIKQKEIQELLLFNISKIRGHEFKTNEVYLPLEKFDDLDSIGKIKSLIHFAYFKQEK
ncbi:hypothetical protein [Peribacillus frigoritolerans]|uniref:hypothetical protein n=1 Tax=Peribacillus frigoritolerans TaxID=450367 RepID=UPI002E201604|nr:hypothetical protein [Peribacillus frigoritolerans]